MVCQYWAWCRQIRQIRQIRQMRTAWTSMEEFAPPYAYPPNTLHRQRPGQRYIAPRVSVAYVTTGHDKTDML
eukprot:3441853-Rhodomonas_salina.4